MEVKRCLCCGEYCNTTDDIVMCVICGFRMKVQYYEEFKIKINNAEENGYKMCNELRKKQLALFDDIMDSVEEAKESFIGVFPDYEEADFERQQDANKDSENNIKRS